MTERGRRWIVGTAVREALTGDDNETYELLNIIAGFGFIVGVLLEILDFFLQWYFDREGSFNFAFYMGGLSTGVLALAAAFRVKSGPPQQLDRHEP